MKITYKDLVGLVERYNTLLWEKELDVLCYISGKSMFTKEIVLSENANGTVFYEYFQGNSFIVDVVTIAKEKKVPISELIKSFVTCETDAATSPSFVADVLSNER